MLKARIYRVFALVFSVVGLVVFMFIYVGYAKNDLFFMLTNPLMISMIIFPFIPTFILLMMAKRLDKKLEKLISEL